MAEKNIVITASFTRTDATTVAAYRHTPGAVSDARKLGAERTHPRSSLLWSRSGLLPGAAWC